jgi:hypothetical protein
VTDRARWGPVAAIGAGLLVLAVLALPGWSAVGAGLLGLALVGLWWRRRGSRRPVEVQHADPPDRGPPATEPTIIDVDVPTGELCLAWRRSYRVLHDLPPGTEHLAGELVRARAALLDELERRDPAGFARWLDTGARAGSDPARFLVDDR